MEKVKERLLETAAHDKSIVLFGESGAGKSLFLIKLIQELWYDKAFNGHHLAYYKLRDLSGVGSTEK